MGMKMIIVLLAVNDLSAFGGKAVHRGFWSVGRDRQPTEMGVRSDHRNTISLRTISDCVASTNRNT